MFKDKMGSLSSKRITGFSLICFVCTMVIVDAVLVGFNLATELSLSLLGAGVTLLGIGVAERNK